MPFESSSSHTLYGAPVVADERRRQTPPPTAARVVDATRSVELERMLALVDEFVPASGTERVAATLERLFVSCEVANPSGLEHLDLLALQLDASMARLRFLKDLAMVARFAHRKHA